MLEGTQRWDELPADQQRPFARMAEVYAGYMEHTDEQIGRLIDALEMTGQLDNTLLFVFVALLLFLVKIELRVTARPNDPAKKSDAHHGETAEQTSNLAQWSGARRGCSSPCRFRTADLLAWGINPGVGVVASASRSC